MGQEKEPSFEAKQVAQDLFSAFSEKGSFSAAFSGLALPAEDRYGKVSANYEEKSVVNEKKEENSNLGIKSWKYRLQRDFLKTLHEEVIKLNFVDKIEEAHYMLDSFNEWKNKNLLEAKSKKKKALNLINPKSLDEQAAKEYYDAVKLGESDIFDDEIKRENEADIEMWSDIWEITQTALLILDEKG